VAQNSALSAVLVWWWSDMCAYSAISDYGQRMSSDWWDMSKLKEFQELLKTAKMFDEKTNQPHCEDPQKQVWITAVEQRVKEVKL
jgi:hypothetical protein